MISEVFKTYSNFINQGGPVVFILFLISIYLFILIAAKFKFLFFEIDNVKSQFKKDYQNITNDKYLSLNQSILKSDFKTVVGREPKINWFNADDETITGSNPKDWSKFGKIPKIPLSLENSLDIGLKNNPNFFSIIRR